ncbi:dynamin family protein [Bacillus sanguinis]
MLQDMGNRTDLKKINEARNQVLKEQFQVVVVGEFSRGKSTFINALFGQKAASFFGKADNYFTEHHHL